MTMALALGALPTTAFPQAAAESALTTASSASSTVKAASALNQSSKQLAGRFQERVSKSLQSGMQENKQKLQLKSQASGGTVRSDSPLEKATISIQGAEVTCAPTNPKTPEGKPNPESGHTNCRSEDPSLKPGPQNKYKSVITLSFPK
jgi:hypothetical protein